MSGLAESGGAGELGPTDGRLAALEAENAALRTALEQLRGASTREAQIRLVADALPVLISYVDAGQCYRFNNKAYEAWFGGPRKAFLGRHLRDVLGEEAYAGLRPMVESALAGERVSADTRIGYKDGGLRHVHLEYVPDRRADGSVAGFFALVQDITDRHRVERELRESEARFRAMADCAPAPVWVTGPAGIEFVNRAFVEVAGIPTAELTGEAWTGMIHADDLAKVLERRQQAWQERTGYDYDARFRRADGEWRWMHVSCNPRFDDKDVLIGYVGMAVDFTEAHRVEQELRESEARFRAMADSAPAPVWVTNAAGIEFANQALAEFTGLSVEQLVGGVWLTLIHPDDADAVQARRAEAWAAQAPYAFEARFRRADGAWRWLRATCKPREQGGAFLGYVGMAVDVTEAKRAEAELRESEARFRRIADSSPVMMWVTRPDRKRDFVNQAYVDFLGISREAAVDFDWRTIIHPDDGERILAESLAGEASLETFALEGRFRRHDGGYRWLRSVSQPRFGPNGEHIGFIGAAHDITEAKEAESLLRDETRTLETLNRVGAALAAELDLERVVQMVTDAGVELSGAQIGAFFYNARDSAGECYMLYALSGVERSAFDKFPMPRNTAIFAPTFAGEGVVRSDDITKDPRYGKSDTHYGMPKEHLPVCSYLAVPVVSRSGEVIGGLFFGHPEPARFGERHERLLVGIAGQASVAIDNARLFEAAQREIAERARVEEALRELNQSLEARIAAAVAERERAEEALRQSQKMEAVGQLTGGIAHDFNNLLTVIGGNLDAARRRLGDRADPAVLRAIGSATVGAERAATLTQRLLAFSRRQPLAPKPIDPNRLVTAMSELLQRTLGETVIMETALAPRPWRVEVDPHQLENALLNLAVNARDAMPDGGRLRIETANVELDAEAAGDDRAAAGQYVRISMSDTGIGMDEEMLARACEPFFTTKEVGKGTGLGLSMVYGFVRQSGGDFRIESAPGQGTRVTLHLPRLQGESADDEVEPAGGDLEGGRDETILVCEDDEDVRAFTVEVLRELGYRVIEAADGPAALRLLDEADGAIDLLFTDVVLPSGMTGAELARQARAVRPELKTLFTTGYARDAIVHDGRLDPGVELIAKPFGYAELAERVRQLLDGE